MMKLSADELGNLTKEYGGEWALNHAKRLLKLISIIGKEIEYNHDAVMIAAYIHDWGAYNKWAVPGVDHAIRSKQIAEEFLKSEVFDKNLTDLILECIEYHHSADNNNSIEAKLLSDADALDFLGITGILRVFSKRTGDLKSAYETAKYHRDKLPSRLLIDKSYDIAKVRIKLMDKVIADFENETFGLF